MSDYHVPEALHNALWRLVGNADAFLKFDGPAIRQHMPECADSLASLRAAVDAVDQARGLRVVCVACGRGLPAPLDPKAERLTSYCARCGLDRLLAAIGPGGGK